MRKGEFWRLLGERLSDIEIGERILQSILHLSAAEGGRVTYAQFGERVAAAEDPPRTPGYSAQTVAAWIQGRGEPSISAFRAMGIVTGVSPSWIAFKVGPAPALATSLPEAPTIQVKTPTPVAAGIHPRRPAKKKGGQKAKSR